jgi:FkbM family methyltransferase
MLKFILKYFYLPVKLLIRKYNVAIQPRFTKPFKNHEKVLGGVIAYNKYGGYFVPLSSKDRPAVQKILKGSIYEPQTINFIKKNCNQGDIIHAGTFFGDFLPGISQSLSKNSILWAFEPNPENFRSAKITCLINNLENIELYNFGLGSEKSTANLLFKLGQYHLGGASRIVSKIKKNSTVSIKINSIDNVIPNERLVSIIQLDIEGYENEALIGGLKTIKRCKPIIILEDNNNVIQSNWFADNILSMGYEVNQKIHNNTLLTVPKYHSNIII